MTLKATLCHFEGVIPFCYLDSAANVSCGVGHLLPTPESACDLPFTMAAGAILATREDIIREYVNVKTLEPNHRPDYYRLKTKLRLSDAAIDRLLDHDIAVKRGSLASLVNVDLLPDPAQIALMDMIFNLGSSGLGRYHRLLAACETRNWTVAANECHRQGISQERNDATAALFRSLVVPFSTSPTST